MWSPCECGRSICHRHYTGRCCHFNGKGNKKPQIQENRSTKKHGKMRACVTKPPLNNVLSEKLHRIHNDANVQSMENCKKVKKEPNHQSEKDRKCVRNHFKSVMQQVEWSTKALRGPSCSKALQRTPNICSSSQHSSKSQKNKPPISRTESLFRKRFFLMEFTAKSCGFLETRLHQVSVSNVGHWRGRGGKFS